MYPLFLVSLTRTSGSKEIYELSDLFGIRIQIEPHRGTGVVQCYKCQRLRHTQHTCDSYERCVKYGQEHSSKLCQKADKSSTVTCANCKDQHTASYKGCPVIKAANNRQRAAGLSYAAVVHGKHQENRNSQLPSNNSNSNYYYYNNNKNSSSHPRTISRQ